MYKLNACEDEFALLSCGTAKEESAFKWHRRLAHISFGNMKFLKDICNEVTSIGCKCIVCIKGKQTRQPFQGKGERANEPLELVHTDLVGPMPTASLGGHRYFLNFVDDYSKKVFIYPLKLKSEAFNFFVEFKNYAEKQTGKKLKMIRSDNGGEFVNKQFEKFTKEHGIIHQKTVQHTPQLNGVVERMNRTIVERIRCMLIDANLGQEFWAEALNTAVFILNLIPRKSDKSPNKLWNDEEVNLNRLRVFGCKAMAHIPKQTRKKLDEKSIECIFVGYASNVSAYRLYDPTSKKVILSRDVIFLEDEQFSKNENENAMLLSEDKANIEDQTEAVIVPTTYDEAMSSKESCRNGKKRWIRNINRYKKIKHG